MNEHIDWEPQAERYMHVSTFLLKEDLPVSGPARTYFIFILSQKKCKLCCGCAVPVSYALAPTLPGACWLRPEVLACHGQVMTAVCITRDMLLHNYSQKVRCLTPVSEFQ